MKRRDLAICISALTLMVAAAAGTKAWSGLQRLGQPGVRVVAKPFPGVEPKTDGTNRTFSAGSHSIPLPEQIPGYRSEVMPITRLVYDWLPEDTTYGQRLCTAPDGFQIQNLVVLMGSDRTSIHQPQYCLTGAGWTIRKQESTTVRMVRPAPYDLPVTVLQTWRQFKDAEGRTAEMSGVFVYWFVADGLLSNDHKERMWLMAKDLILKRTLQRWAYVIYFAPCPPGAEAATFERIKAVMAASVPEYQLVPPPPA
jgi:hypothetical protein